MDAVVSLDDILGGYSRHSLVVSLWGVVEGTLSRRDTRSVFLDLLKALNCVDRNIIINKMEHCGIRGVPLKWFESYYNNKIENNSLNFKNIR